MGGATINGMKHVIRKADANWKGSLTEGHGLVSTESRVLTEEKFSFSERVEGEGKDTNPEELIGAATASCFAMALSKTLQDKDLTADKLRVSVEVRLDVKDEGPQVSGLNLHAEALIGEINEEDFDSAVNTTAENCPVLKLLKPGLEDLNISSKLHD